MLHTTVTRSVHSPLTVVQKCRRVLLRFIPRSVLSRRGVVRVLENNVLRVRQVGRFVSDVEGVAGLRRQRLGYSIMSVQRLVGRVRTLTRIIIRGSRGGFAIAAIERSRVLATSRRVVVRMTSGLLTGTFHCTGRRIELGLAIAPRCLGVDVESSKVKFRRGVSEIARTFCRRGPRSSLGRFKVNVCVDHVCYRQRNKGLLVGGMTSNNTRIRTIFGGCMLRRRRRGWVTIIFLL